MAINILDGFSLRAKKFLDARSSFATLDEMNAWAANSVPEGFITYNEEDKKSYQWDGQKWTEYTAGGGGGGTWTSTDPTAVTVGGLKQGTKPDWSVAVIGKKSKEESDRKGCHPGKGDPDSEAGGSGGHGGPDDR